MRRGIGKMYLLIYFCIMIVNPYVRGKIIPIPLEANVIPKNNSSLQIETKVSNITNVTLNTEGGSVKPEIPLMSLPKESHSDLTNLDKEIGKPKEKSVVPRKGVRYESMEDSLSNLNHTRERIDSTVSDFKTLSDAVIAASVQPAASKLSTPSYSSSTAENTKDRTTNTSQSSMPEVPKKPLVLSAEAVAETDKKVQMEKAKTESSSKSIVSDQLPSPSVKHEPVIHSSHPDMVMPIVITMLVVPMFAVLGYMALRRGQEAWKNRHYKRMDFLLDGMYND